MAFDFEPEIDPSLMGDTLPRKSKKVEETERQPEVKQEIVATEATLVTGNIGSSDVVTMNNLLGLTQSHIDDDNSCRAVINDLTEELNDSIRLMSIKELIEYLKVKIREREFHVDCIFKAYAFIQKSEVAKEMLLGSTRKERIIEVSDRKRITGLLSMLNGD